MRSGSTLRHLLAVAMGVASATMIAAPSASAEPATCAPYQLPAFPGSDGGGNVMWINDAGLYVGAAGAADGNHYAAWWTHAGSDDGAGWTVHQVPGVPANAIVLDVNAHGVMVGSVDDSGVSFVYNSNTAALSWLPDLVGGYATYGRRINGTGEISGGAQGRDTSYASVWFPPYTQAHRLPDAGASQSVGTKDAAHDKMFNEADGLNDAGTSAGLTALGGHLQDTSTYARDRLLRGGIAPLYIPVQWRANGQLERLPAGPIQAGAFAINNAGTAVGWAARPDGTWSPAYWRDGQVHDMGAPADSVYGVAYGLSQGGWAAGGVDLADESSRAFIWTGSGSLQTLAGLPGRSDSWAHAASDTFAQVGGSSYDGDGNPYPTVWQCPAGFTTR